MLSAARPHPKGQQVMSVILLTAIMLSVSIGAYAWGRGMLETSMERRDYERMERFMLDINENIKEVARRGGRKEMSIDLPQEAEFRVTDTEEGQLDNITLTFDTTIRTMAQDTDIVIVGSPGTESPVTESPETIIARSERIGDGYNVNFKLYYRNTTIDGEAVRRIEIDTPNNQGIAQRGGQIDLLIERGPSYVMEDGFTVNKIKIRII